MSRSPQCDFCGKRLDAGRQFIYEFESLKYAGDDATLAAIRATGRRFPGEPRPLCRTCGRTRRRPAFSVALHPQITDAERLRAYAAIGFGAAMLLVASLLMDLLAPDR